MMKAPGSDSNELTSDADFFYASLSQIDVQVSRIFMGAPLLAGKGKVQAFNTTFIKIDGTYYVRNGNIFLMSKERACREEVANIN